MVSYEDIFQGTAETAALDIGQEISTCVLSLLSSQILTLLNNAISEKLSGLQAELLSLDAQIAELEAIQNEPDDALGEAITSLENLTSIGNPFQIDTIDVACIGSIPTLGLELNAFGISNPFSSLAMILIAAIKLTILTALRAAVMALIIKLLADSQKVSETLQGRADGTLTEPKIDWSNPDLSEYVDSLEPGDLARIERYKEFALNNIVKPYEQNAAGIAAYQAQFKAVQEETEEEENPFDIIFGPPISTSGKFILSRDGLYYDSRGGGVPNVVAQEILASNWQLKYNPNKGGKGVLLHEDRLKDYSNTVFSDEYTETNDVVEFLYKNDDILQSFISDKAIQTNEVSGQISELVASGYTRSSAIVQNYYRSIAAIAYSYDDKIRKRRKQLQVAGLYGTYTITEKTFPLGGGYILDSSGARYDIENFPPGYTISPDNIVYFNTETQERGVTVHKILDRIPLNDFGYLKGSGLVPDLQFQQEALLQSADVSGIILPIAPKFIKAANQNTVFLRDLNVSPEGNTDFPHIETSPADYASVSSVKPFIKSLDDGIETDSLIVCYNFLKGDVEAPSSLDYKLDNKASSYTHLNGKLVGKTATDVFPSGLSIPYLRGVLYDAEGQFSPEPWYSNVPNGSYVRLKNNISKGELTPFTESLDGLTYSDAGFSVDFWAHIPEVWSSLRSWHRYRVIFGCENSGQALGLGSAGAVTENPNTILPDGRVSKERDPSKVHGLIMGWRDKKNNATDGMASTNSNINQLEFVVLPTVSQNKPDGKFGHSVAIAGIPSNPYDPNSTYTELGFKVPVDVFTEAGALSGVSISSVQDTFMHTHVSVNYKGNEISLYLDGKKLISSSISDAFYLDAAQPLNVPSFVEKNFGYENSLGVRTSVSKADNYTESLHEGSVIAPELPMQTPWIIGGGFTDTCPRSYEVQEEVGFNTTPFGFLGSNTNDTYFTKVAEVSSGGITGQHTPGLGGCTYSGVNRNIPRSGLDGYVGSFKLYTRPLNTNEVEKNFDAQKGYFKNINIT